MVILEKLRVGLKVQRIKCRLGREVEYDDYSLIPIGATGIVVDWLHLDEIDIDSDWDNRYVQVAWDKPYRKKMSGGWTRTTYRDEWADADNCWKVHPKMLSLVADEKAKYEDLVKKIKYLDKRFSERKAHVQSR